MPNLQKKVENCLEQNDIYQKLPGRIEELMRKEAYDIQILDDKISSLDEDSK